MLIPILGIKTNGCDNLIITDETEYGANDNGVRSDYLVSIAVQQITANETIDFAIPQVPTIVSQVNVPITSDGWYKVTLTILHADNERFAAVPLEQHSLVRCRALACICELSKATKTKDCGCKDSNTNEMSDLLKAHLMMRSAVSLFKKGDRVGGRDAITSINALCEQNNNGDCGC